MAETHTREHSLTNTTHSGGWTLSQTTQCASGLIGSPDGDTKVCSPEKGIRYKGTTTSHGNRTAVVKKSDEPLVLKVLGERGTQKTEKGSTGAGEQMWHLQE